MQTKDFDYDLPKELIAQTPVFPRDHSRLLVMNRKNGNLAHRRFYELADCLNPGDCLIVNDSRVLPARIYGNKKDTGGHMEFLLLTQTEHDIWEVLAKPGRKAQPGTCFVFGNGLLQAQVLQILEDGKRLVRFFYSGNFYTLLEQIGQMPLPPYITETLTDKERYQTIYSKELGSAAAPTAGLHFTPELMRKIEEKGVCFGYVTLHVGLGTFRPVSAARITEHIMHAEHYYLPKETADLINQTKQNGGRVIAVGTTSCRTLESALQKEGRICESEGWTDIFIYPGYRFAVLDGLLTNFHLPESTLIMLVCAFSGYANTMRAYQIAVQERYRFFSFGDAMLIL